MLLWIIRVLTFLEILNLFKYHQEQKKKEDTDQDEEKK
tara:strand:+ start:62 stop:175 length:114 start_codon:yes stop_codon:yes gene_type:complete